MKTRHMIGLVAMVFLVVCVTVSRGQPMGSTSRPLNYLMTAEDLSNWSCGLYGAYNQRDVTFDGQSFTREFKTQGGRAYVGYRLVRWATAYASVGITQAKIDNTQYGDEEGDYGLGVRVNLLDHDVMSPTLFEDAIAIDVSAQYTRSETEWVGEAIEWQELRADVIFSIINDVVGHKDFWVDSIGIFAGPVFSDIQGDIDEDQSIGGIVGIEFFVSDRVSVNFAFESIDAGSFTGGLNVEL